MRHRRRALATGVVCQGAAFKDVADILGHRCLTTTGIYAKLDLPALAQVALPFAGGSAMTATDIQCRLEAYLLLWQSLGFVV